MRILILSREYPPHVYGGAGVHVEFLSRELAKIAEVEVRCFGTQMSDGGQNAPVVRGFGPSPAAYAGLDPRLQKVLEPLSVGVAMAGTPADADIIHCHTWYSMMAGLWLKLLYGTPLVITTHSLEPLRPWKEEQLGRGYHVSSWIERTAIEAADRVIAVSEGTRREVLECYSLDPARVQVIHNGIDLNVYRRKEAGPVLEKYGIPREKPFMLFVGRITRQKGVIHLVRALERVSPDLNAVLCAGAPDTEDIGREMEAAVRALQAKRPGVFWIREMVPVPDIVAFYSAAALFVCPSIYEPFGIINLEAMACECPVVASRVGGIPEAVADGETGVLVPFESRGGSDFEPRDPQKFALDLAGAVNKLWSDAALRRRMAAAGRRRVEEMFSWTTIAQRTLDLFGELVGEKAAQPR
ncbi:MAG TPA: glycogen synthase [Planctomycetota bacterium]|nr:glycogen synthase [Planctomycetota bacterium]